MTEGCILSIKGGGIIEECRKKKWRGISGVQGWG